MQDWIGLVFIVLLIVGALIGLKTLSKPRISTAEEFERRASEEKTMLGASMNALQAITDPADARSKEVIAQMKEGRYQKKKREGKADGTTNEDNEQPKTDDQ
jgi:hypothetical protein